MSIPIISLFYFFGSLIFFIWAILYIINPFTDFGPYLGLACATFYLAASSTQLGKDIKTNKKENCGKCYL